MRFYGPTRAPVHEQAAARGESPPVGATAGELRRAGYDVSACVNPAARYVTDDESPTRYRWDDGDAWDKLAWWMRLDVATAEAAYVRRIIAEVSNVALRDEARSRIHAPSATDVDAMVAEVSSLPAVFRACVDEMLGGPVAEVSDAREIERATWRVFLVALDVVFRKFIAVRR